MIKIDLQDAYFHVPIHKKYSKYLKFKSKGKLYKFVCLPFGLSTSPYIFTKLLKPVMKSLRSLRFIPTIYLDDILVIGNDYKKCKSKSLTTVSLLEKLGFLINLKKSVLTPTTCCEYLRFIVNSKNCTLTLTQKKKKNLIDLTEIFLCTESCKIKELAQLIGNLVAACPAITYG